MTQAVDLNNPLSPVNLRRIRERMETLRRAVVEAEMEDEEEVECVEEEDVLAECVLEEIEALSAEIADIKARADHLLRARTKERGEKTPHP